MYPRDFVIFDFFGVKQARIIDERHLTANQQKSVKWHYQRVRKRTIATPAESLPAREAMYAMLR